MTRKPARLGPRQQCGGLRQRARTIAARAEEPADDPLLAARACYAAPPISARVPWRPGHFAPGRASARPKTLR